MSSKKQTILIVDDNKSNIDILLSVLNDYDVIPTLTGKSAINIVLEEDIDLILLDIIMPDMDGFEVCRILKSNQNIKKVPILFLTAKHEMDDITTGFDLGAVDYITKPFNPSELLSRIKTHLELRSYQKDLESKVEKEIENNRLKEQIIFQQSKQAEVGELLMHIAHQWKQPLSKLASVNMYNLASLEINDEISKDDLKESFSDTSEIIEFMSKSVETFQNFYNPKCENESFEVKDAINTAVNMVSATFRYNHIDLNIDIKVNSTIYGNKNEYSQIILAILNNAKDNFAQRETKNPKVNIKVEDINGKSSVNITDNGGGIKIDNIYDIFLPFISDKKSTGMGLYMSKSIIEKNGGRLNVENIPNGVSFTIII